MAPRLSKTKRLSIVICLSAAFFIAEISVGFHSHSLALVADAFHYMNDLIGFTAALIGLKLSGRSNSPKQLSYGWQRAPLLGAFFNGVFLLALGVSIFLQAIERTISLEKVRNPELILIMGCIGLALNMISAACLHEHAGKEIQGPLPAGSNDDLSASTEEADPEKEQRRKVGSSWLKGRDLGMMGVLIHVISDAINNIGVIIAGAVIWKAKNESRYYADPVVSIAIGILILLSALPLVKSSGLILLESVPIGVDLDVVKRELERIPGVSSIHELHAWRLTQNKAVASVHVVTSDQSLVNFTKQAQLINDCLHTYGIHSATLQPELADSERANNEKQLQVVPPGSACRINCGTLCEELTCCAKPTT